MVVNEQGKPGVIAAFPEKRKRPEDQAIFGTLLI
jgi:hypothetical protein